MTFNTPSTSTASWLGSHGGVRFASNKWTVLDEKIGYPAKIIHLVPLIDGSVLQLAAGPNETITLNLSAPTSPDVDEKKIKELVAQMSNPDPTQRKAAFDELQRYGNTSWPVLEKLQNSQPLEARVRIRQLLQNRIQPTLGGHTLVDNKARVAARLGDGGVVLYAPVGVSVLRDDGTSVVVNPAWISIRPGSPIELLEEVLTRDADPDKDQLFAQADEWILSNDTQGPQRLEGNHLQPLLGEKELQFTRFIAIDRHGRWLFRKPQVEAAISDQQTLLLDSTVPDPRPRLPIWTLNIKEGQVGWQKDNWPVIKRPGAWMLTEYGWQGIDEKKAPILTAPPPYEVILPPPSTAPATTRSTRPSTSRASTSASTRAATQASTAPATTPSTTQASTQPQDHLLLIDAEGRRYYDGVAKLTVIEKSGKRIDWPLPASAVGKSPVHLVRAKDGALFLFNAPGRILKIIATPPAPRATPVSTTQPEQPFTLDATFTHRVPNIDNPTRIWVDPANRIIMTYDTHMAIMFPEGRIPPQIARLIPASELEDQEP
jgi:hypothetical protein